MAETIRTRHTSLLEGCKGCTTRTKAYACTVDSAHDDNRIIRPACYLRRTGWKAGCGWLKAPALLVRLSLSAPLLLFLLFFTCLLLLPLLILRLPMLLLQPLSLLLLPLLRRLMLPVLVLLQQVPIQLASQEMELLQAQTFCPEVDVLLCRLLRLFFDCLQSL